MTTYNPKTGNSEHNDMPKAEPAPKRKVTFKPSEPPRPAIPAVSRPRIPVPTIQQAPVTSRPVPSKPTLTAPEIQKTDETAKPIPSRPFFSDLKKQWEEQEIGYGILMRKPTAQEALNYDNARIDCEVAKVLATVTPEALAKLVEDAKKEAEQKIAKLERERLRLTGGRR